MPPAEKLKFACEGFDGAGDTHRRIAPTHDAIASCAIADPEGGCIGPGIDTVLIGPEGGFTQGERDLVSRRLALSANVLRVETAALAAAFLLTQRNQST